MASSQVQSASPEIAPRVQKVYPIQRSKDTMTLIRIKDPLFLHRKRNSTRNAILPVSLCFTRGSLPPWAMSSGATIFSMWKSGDILRLRFLSSSTFAMRSNSNIVCRKGPQCVGILSRSVLIPLYAAYTCNIYTTLVQIWSETQPW